MKFNLIHLCFLCLISYQAFYSRSCILGKVKKTLSVAKKKGRTIQSKHIIKLIINLLSKINNEKYQPET